ncbi:MAG: dehydrogenase (quinone) subunit [Chloroflexota bacterium]|jgi:NADH-quinone oxidoreductase subunit D|nr:MAG: NADH dehydrogenase (quinone) subunit D [Chloroflexota bacterium]RLT50113.1 MAG: NADH dehydrogenase (quinone) subunit D [Chloroflexota bacterium]RLT54653.1 MAG: NADH dehydrogenase (quinone) subunit D [Chloroflexota bacterium]
MSQVRELETTVEELKHLFSPRAATGETMLLNLGPQHPSTHGVLRLLLELDGEEVVSCIPDVGFLHTGIEKNMEAKTFLKALVMTDRMDYLNNMGNNLTYCLAIEKLCAIEVPERAQVLRVICAELQRIASHLVWLGTSAIDLNASSILIYCFRDRERIMDLFELIGGQRMMTSYIRPGGVWRDVPAEFPEAVESFLDYLPKKLDDYERLLDKNPIYLARTIDIGIVDGDEALAWGMTGPALRGSGVNFDVRRAMPYSGYENFEFDVPLETGCDVYARYRVRMREFRESIKIIRQGLRLLKPGPFITSDRKFAPPPRAELGRSMEAVIHHFKYWTDGFPAPDGEVYVATESPRGELGCLLAGDGGPNPRRVHFRTPSFNTLQVLSWLGKGYLVADLVAIIGSIDIVLGDVDR